MLGETVISEIKSEIAEESTHFRKVKEILFSVSIHTSLKDSLTLGEVIGFCR